MKNFVHGHFSNLVEVLRLRASSDAHKPAYTFLNDGETQEEILTYEELDRQARAIGAMLQNAGAENERVLLLYPPGLSYIAAYFGCLYAGAIAVPSYPVRTNKQDSRLQAIVMDSLTTIALTLERNLPDESWRQANVPSIRWFTTDSLSSSMANEWKETSITGDTLAFLQYTSGSTAMPKGVMVSHGNLIHNLELICSFFKHTPESQGVIWLPPYHDMGLIGGILQPLYVGFRVALMSPVAFMEKPIRWLQAITRFKGTTSGGPNFAYELCAKKITDEQKAGLDLSSWDLAFNGAEPVRQETMKMFIEAFGQHGFRKEAFYPCYGLAEATLIVSGGKKEEKASVKAFKKDALEQKQAIPAEPGNTDVRTMVGCGYVAVGQRIAVVNPDSQEECLTGQIGEIWVSGPSVAKGYWDRPVASMEVFNAYIKNTKNGPYLRTGDLGFMSGGELFITGRIKDLIVIRGRNHYPQDIELTVEKSHPALRAGCGAAFSVDVGDEERLIIVYEVERTQRKADVNEVATAVRQAVAEGHELAVHTFVMVKTSSTPKTSSGKIKRHACRNKYLEESLEILGTSTLDNDISEGSTALKVEENFIKKALTAVYDKAAKQSLLNLYLKEQAVRILRISKDKLDVGQPLSSVGLDSLMAVELTHHVESSLGIAIPIVDLLQGANIEQISLRILEELEKRTEKSEEQGTIIESGAGQCPPSYGQRALWFLNKLASESPAYNISSAVRIKNKLDVSAFQRAFRRLAERHPSLRTTFPGVNGRPVQHVHNEMEIEFYHKDSCRWDCAAINEYIDYEAHRVFDIEKGPLFRAHLLECGSEEYIFLFVIHHIISDFWSLAVIAREFGEFYASECSGVPVRLSPITYRYTDYVRWQEQLLAGAEGIRLEAYWKKKLGGELPKLNLPTDYPRPHVQTYRGASQALELGHELTELAKNYGQTHGTTLYMTLMTVLQVLLYRYTGQDDIIVGTPATGRSRAGFGGLVGYFINMLPLRVDLGENPTFNELLCRVRKTVLEAFDHQDYPFGRLVEQVNIERDSSRSPVFQIAFAFQQSLTTDDAGLTSFALSAQGFQVDINGLTFESMELEQRGVPFDIMVMAAEGPNGVGISMRYNRDLFDSSTISRMLGHFKILLENIMTEPSKNISDYGILSEEERKRILIDWNNTKTQYPHDKCAHQLFEEQVDKSPNEIAVVFKEERLTYSELNRKANQLGRYLQKLGVGLETLVGIYTERSPGMIIGMLGVLKAGGAYVPLDPDYPNERLAFMLEDTCAPVVLTQKKLLDKMPNINSNIICLDKVLQQISQECGENIECSAAPDNPVYVIYTSGSTGKPKGAVLLHRGLVNYLTWCKIAYPLNEGAGAPVHSSISFDLTVTSIFSPLISGRTVHLLPQGPSIETLSQVLREVGDFSLVKITPAHLELLGRQLYQQEAAGRTRAFIIGGENLLAESTAFWQDNAPDTILVNEYGPTETVVGCCTYQVVPGKGRDGSIPIGRPIINTRLYILDNSLNPVPIGVAGELYIGGAGVARGYWNCPELTAEKFIPDPFSDETGSRLYRTGDMARYLPDGNIEFLGRVDRQVKIRGYRIELEEIEAALLSNKEISECVVDIVASEQRLQSHSEIKYCTRCVIPSNYPGITFDEKGVCSMCAAFENYKSKAMEYFKTMDDFKAIFEAVKASERGKYDCLVLYSGGKDSTYMLYKVVSMGLKVLAYTFDNGYLYEGAKDNILRVVKELGVDHVMGTTPFIKDILADGLKRYSNVCNSCFKVIYTLSINLAGEYGIKHVVTGLSRGQIFETRLMNIFTNNPGFNVRDIDDTVLEARKVYHRMDDAISRCLDVSIFKDDRVFEDIQFEDFYRYCDVSQEEIYSFLEKNVPWRNPAGTGCTTNCLVNDAGIYVHTKEKGFHNYALPESWEVRLGHAARKVVLKEIESNVDEELAKRILSEIGYSIRERNKEKPDKYLAAYYVSNSNIPVSAHRAFLSQKLPEYMIPAHFIKLDKLPLTINGKVDRSALPVPGYERPEIGEEYIAPETPIQKGLAAIWSRVIGIPRVGVNDDFFELGGHSLMAFQIISHVQEEFQVTLSLKRFFEVPTLAFMAEEIERQMGMKGQEPIAAAVLPNVISSQDDKYLPFPLTDVQQAYWIGRRDAYELGNVAAHGYTEIDLEGFDVQRFEIVLQRLIERHDMLRSIIREGQQQVLEYVPRYKVKVIDLRELITEQNSLMLEETREEMSHQILSSDQWPLFDIRASLLKSDRVRLHISVDVLIGDAWSWQIIGRELNKLYMNESASLPKLELSFRDYVLTEAKLADTEGYKKSYRYWQERLPKLPSAPDLPLAKSPSYIKNPRFVRRTGRLSAEAWNKMKMKISSMRLTPSAVLAAAFAEVLTVWSKSPHFTLNLTLFNRLPMHPQVNDIVGDFTSLTLLEIDNREQNGFDKRVLNLQEQLWENLDNRYYSGLQVMRDLSVMRGEAQKAAMPVVFTSILNQPAAEQDESVLIDFNALGFSDSEDGTYSISQTPQVWLDHQTAEYKGALVFNWDAVEELFPSGLLDDMFTAYCNLLEKLANSEGAWGEATNLLVPLPLEQLNKRESVNNTSVPISNELLHNLLIKKAIEQPELDAVICSGRTMTYGELYIYSRRIGQWLRKKGACPNRLVAVVMEKGWEQVTAVLGVLFSGAAYLPINPELPKERIKYLLENGEVELVLTQKRFGNSITLTEGVELLCVDGEELPDTDEECISESQQKPEDLAYVIYTSGSTGFPKGVMIDHKGAMNTILDINRRFDINRLDRVLALSSLSFDLSVYDIFGVLGAGGTIVIPDKVAERDPGHWLELMRREKISVWNSVPALLEMLMEYVEVHSQDLPRSLRLVMLSGDWIPVALPGQIRSKLKDVKLVSLGGATEASIWSIFYPIEQVEADWKSIPYGMPMANQTFHVLDAKLSPKPDWVPGQLYIGGAGLAKGYWKDSEKTQTSFIIHPETGECLYRTGDLGRYLPDGNIEFLGREDYQVKIRGYRIELGEIESVLGKHPDVQSGIVTVNRDSQGERYLAAYVVPKQLLTDEANVAEKPQSYHIIQDPIARFRHKMSHPGVRKIKEDNCCIKLERPQLSEAEVENYTARRSYRRFMDTPITLGQLNLLLNCFYGIDLEGVPLRKYRYGSAGSLYPVQIYLYLKSGRIEGLAGGAYYYHPEEHYLVLLKENAEMDSMMFASGNRDIFEESAFVIFLVGELDAVAPMYGEWSRDFCLLEAGMMSQLMEMAAPRHELGFCQVGGFDFAPVRVLFGLGESQIYLHSLLGGQIHVKQRGIHALVDDSKDVHSMLELIKEQGSDEDNGCKSFEPGKHISYEPALNSGTKLVEELRKYLRSKLPEYMVPSSIVLLDKIPLTPNGKVDHKALVKLGSVRKQQPLENEMPANETERIIAEILKDILNVEHVNVYENLFNLGVNSLQIIKIHGRLEELMEKKISIVKIFENPTIRDLAKHLSKKKDEAASTRESQERSQTRKDLMRQRAMLKDRGRTQQ
ncbi:amino acid adenylation domain-containing protein [Anaerobacterium chartisolvens]|uniref:Amino acid adenylation domain-containing protein n=1 Tax=Anaerobacterium chartisolvens TaxID=1297424 RepID=A0A369BA02_9FIRM|nr:non-ribosomal peptide synthetase [Anaerobacterium chartisolvens]RCX18350.1 amino acid adenylation domain-containing protein [Anaerobacterium chartisolvens]